MLIEKVFVFLRRPLGESHDTFRVRYLDKHAAGILQHPGVGRYVANLVEQVPEELTRGGWSGAAPGLVRDGTGVDAMDELWLKSADDALSLYRGDSIIVAAYRVQERIIAPCQPTWPVGQRSPWLKRVLFMERARAMSHGEFSDHWKHVHGPLALTHHAGAARYVQNLITGSLMAGSPGWDGIVQLHYWNAANFLEGHFATPESKDVIAADMRIFISPPVEVRLMSEYILRP